MKLQLFRIKLVQSKQGLLFPDDVSERLPQRNTEEEGSVELVSARDGREQLLQRTIEAKPSVELARGQVWSIGNVERLDKHGYHFKFGRRSKATMDIFDEGTKDFEEREIPNAPFTSVFVDTRFQVCAIAAKPRLLKSVTSIAHRLERMLTKYNVERDVTFEISPLRNPENLLSHLRAAVRITKFEMEFSRPNPFDAEEMFHKPLSNLLGEAGGTKGKATIDGGDLRLAPIEELVRSASATGNNATAWYQPPGNGPVVKRDLKDDAVVLTEEEQEVIDEMKEPLLHQMRALYDWVKGIGGDIS